jgi:ribosome maturation factor RimP
MTQRARGGGRPATNARQSGSPDRDRIRQPWQPTASRGDVAARRSRLRAVVEPVVIAAGYDLEDLSLSRAGRRHIVRIIVDGDGGVSLDAVATVSRAVSGALDEAEEIGGELLAGEYQLEVSSPGVDRPLTLPRHWRRNVGRLVRATVAGRQMTGRVVAADDDGVVLDVDGTTAEWNYPDLGPGRVQVEFTRLHEAELGDDDVDVDDEDVEDEER